MVVKVTQFPHSCLGHMFKGVKMLLKVIERFPEEIEWRHYLIVAYLTLGRNEDARTILQHTLRRWPKDGFTKVHYGFLLKLVDKDYKNGKNPQLYYCTRLTFDFRVCLCLSAAKYMQEGIETKEAGTQDGRFFYHLGDAYMRLGDKVKEKATYEAGTKQGLFLSAQQRSLHNVDRLKARPWWTVDETTYGDDLR